MERLVNECGRSSKCRSVQLKDHRIAEPASHMTLVEETGVFGAVSMHIAISLYRFSRPVILVVIRTLMASLTAGAVDESDSLPSGH